MIKPPDEAEDEKRKSILNDDFLKNNIKLEEYKKKLLNSSEVIDFVQTHSRYIERTLGEKNIIELFGGKDKDTQDNNKDINILEDDGEEHHNKKEKKLVENPLTSLGVFFDETIIFKRAVTDLQWSNKFPEILLAGYSKSDESNVNDPHGLVMLWSLALRKKPEYQFTCQSELTKVMLHPFNPKLILGATHTGQILVWDTRGKQLPIMKTPPGGKYHSHPIYCLAITGSSSNSSIVSISNDGILCTWSPHNLNKATKRIELKAKKKKVYQDLDSTSDTLTSSLTKSSNINSTHTDEFGVICMATQENDSNNVFIGTDDSEIYQISAHQSNDRAENIVESYRHHTGPILSLDMHPEDFFKNANVKFYNYFFIVLTIFSLLTYF
jgi:dynein intermediate chain